MITRKNIFITAFLLLYINCLSQEYTYDTNGNLSKNTNKRIRRIHYNHLNLADTISFEDGRVITCLYSALGRKLKQQVIDANGSMVRRADYLNQFLYDNDTLRQIRDENGRVVPILPGNDDSPWEYQYEQKDQLSNVRAVVTSRQDVDNDHGTFETANINDEQHRFLRYEDVRKINSILFDHTSNGATHFSERLNGSANEKYGLSKSLSVMPGDVINLEVFAKYVDPDASHWTAALNTLISQIAGGIAPVGTVVDGAGYSTSGSIAFPFAGLSGSSSSTGAGPKAYLNWLVFDRNFVFKNGGYARMSSIAKENGTGVPHERLSKQLTIGEAGFVYIYLSNEETTPVDVFFDDFNVQLVKGPVVQQTDYDPFGLAFNEVSREHSEPNNFLYNGKELQKDFDLNLYDYGARMYDTALGKWHVIDPMAEKYAGWSPYNYVANNPLRFVDPDGRELLVIGDEEGKKRVESNIDRFRYMPLIGKFVREIERSKHTVVMRSAPGKGDRANVFDKDGALEKGEKAEYDGHVYAGTGKGSGVYLLIDLSKITKENEPAEVAIVLAHAYKSVAGKFTLEQLNVKGDDGQPALVDVTFIHSLNFENAVRMSVGLPLSHKVQGVTVLDQNGDVVKGFEKFAYSGQEIMELLARPEVMIHSPGRNPALKADFSIPMGNEDN